jgi:hypothetical protein
VAQTTSKINRLVRWDKASCQQPTQAANAQTLCSLAGARSLAIQLYVQCSAMRYTAAMPHNTYVQFDQQGSALAKSTNALPCSESSTRAKATHQMASFKVSCCRLLQVAAQCYNSTQCIPLPRTTSVHPKSLTAIQKRQPRQYSWPDLPAATAADPLACRSSTSHINKLQTLLFE